MFDPIVIGAISTAIVAILGALGLAYRTVREEQRKDAEEGIKRKREEQELVQSLAKGLKEQLDSTTLRVLDLENTRTVLERARQERDAKIEKLEQAQAKSAREIKVMAEEVTKLLRDNEAKDEVIHQQGEQIAKLETDNERLTRRVKLLEDALKQADVPLPNGEGEK